MLVAPNPCPRNSVSATSRMRIASCADCRRDGRPPRPRALDWALSSALPRTIDPIIVVRETLADAQANATGAFFFLDRTDLLLALAPWRQPRQHRTGIRERSDDMNIDLSGKRAIVAGGSRGIGRAIALAFAEAGASVSI